MQHAHTWFSVKTDSVTISGIAVVVTASVILLHMFPRGGNSPRAVVHRPQAGLH